MLRLALVVVQSVTDFINNFSGATFGCLWWSFLTSWDLRFAFEFQVDFVYVTIFAKLIRERVLIGWWIWLFDLWHCLSLTFLNDDDAFRYLLVVNFGLPEVSLLFKLRCTEALRSRVNTMRQSDNILLTASCRWLMQASFALIFTLDSAKDPTIFYLLSLALPNALSMTRPRLGTIRPLCYVHLIHLVATITENTCLLPFLLIKAIPQVYVLVPNLAAIN